MDSGEDIEALSSDADEEMSDDDIIDEILRTSDRTLLASKLEYSAVESKLQSGWQCCHKLQCSFHTTAEEIFEQRVQFQCLAAADRRNRLAHIVSGVHPVADGKQICVDFLEFLLAISYNSIAGAKKMDTPERKGAHRPFAKMQDVVEYLDELASSFEHQPDSKEIHLSHPSRKEVYNGFDQDLHGHVSGSYFNAVWRKHRPHIVLRKYLR